MKAVGEGESLHHTLRGLAQTYVLCTECFMGGHYPKILSAFDFDKQSLEGILKAQLYGLSSDQEHEERNELEIWTPLDRQRLVEGVAQFESDWEQISTQVFDGDFSPLECAHQFLSLPITESLYSRFHQTAAKRANADKRDREAEHPLQDNLPTVFQDASNPLLSQLAIFAKSLEYLEMHDQMKPR